MAASFINAARNCYSPSALWLELILKLCLFKSHLVGILGRGNRPIAKAHVYSTTRYVKRKHTPVSSEEFELVLTVFRQSLSCTTIVLSVVPLRQK
jgi:hypothetical protein